eukprot:183019-Pleurochrysis_carterae.AAC.1
MVLDSMFEETVEVDALHDVVKVVSSCRNLLGSVRICANGWSRQETSRRFEIAQRNAAVHFGSEATACVHGKQAHEEAR